MRLASWAIVGSLVINAAFGLVVTGAVHAADPVVAAVTRCTHHHSPAVTRKPVSGHYLAAVRLGWVVG